MGGTLSSSRGGGDDGDLLPKARPDIPPAASLAAFDITAAAATAPPPPIATGRPPSSPPLPPQSEDAWSGDDEMVVLTASAVPSKRALLNARCPPFGLLMSPLATHAGSSGAEGDGVGGGLIPVVRRAPVRCRRCGAYGHPNGTLLAGGPGRPVRWSCAFCELLQEVEVHS